MLQLFKFASVILTGVFAILGAVYDFKDKNGQITKWGRRNLIALIASLVFSISMFILESVKAKEEAKRSEALLRTATAILNPLNRIVVSYDYTIPMDSLKLAEYKRQLSRLPVIADLNESTTTSGFNFPDRKRDSAAYRLLAQTTTLKFDISKRLEGNTMDSEISFDVEDSVDDDKNERQLHYNPATGRLRISSNPMTATSDNFYIPDLPFGVRDLPGAAFEVEFDVRDPERDYPNPLDGAQIESIELKVPGSIHISRTRKEMKETKDKDGFCVYSFKLPETWAKLIPH